MLSKIISLPQQLLKQIRERIFATRNINTSIIESSLIDPEAKIGKYNYIYNTKIGKYTYTSRNVSIMQTSIGNFCSIAKNASIGIGDHPTNYISTSPIFYSPNNPFRIKLVKQKNFDDIKPVEIGHDVWIGANAVIKNGIKIGNGAIIGANSVVTKNVPNYAIVVGAPARVYKYRFSSINIAEIEASKWWEESIEQLAKRIQDFTEPIK